MIEITVLTVLEIRGSYKYPEIGKTPYKLRTYALFTYYFRGVRGWERPSLRDWVSSRYERKDSKSLIYKRLFILLRVLILYLLCTFRYFVRGAIYVC